MRLNRYTWVVEGLSPGVHAVDANARVNNATDGAGVILAFDRTLTIEVLKA